MNNIKKENNVFWLIKNGDYETPIGKFIYIINATEPIITSHTILNIKAPNVKYHQYGIIHYDSGNGAIHSYTMGRINGSIENRFHCDRIMAIKALMKRHNLSKTPITDRYTKLLFDSVVKEIPEYFV